MLVDLDNKHISKCKNMLSKMEYLKSSLIAASHFSSTRRTEVRIQMFPIISGYLHWNY